MAIGRAQVADLDASRVALWLDDVQVAEGGLMSSSYTEAAGSALAQDEFKLSIWDAVTKKRYGQRTCLMNTCVSTPSIDLRSNPHRTPVALRQVFCALRWPRLLSQSVDIALSKTVGTD